jgi:hypothetical protein
MARNVFGATQAFAKSRVTVMHSLLQSRNGTPRNIGGRDQLGDGRPQHAFVGTQLEQPFVQQPAIADGQDEQHRHQGLDHQRNSVAHYSVSF